MQVPPAVVCSARNNESRLRCLALLQQHAELCGCDLTHALRLAQPHVLTGTVLSSWVCRTHDLTGCLWWSSAFVPTALLLSPRLPAVPAAARPGWERPAAELPPPGRARSAADRGRGRSQCDGVRHARRGAPRPRDLIRRKGTAYGDFVMAGRRVKSAHGRLAVH